MQRIVRRLAIVPVLILIGLGLWVYNHYTLVSQRQEVHAEIQRRVLDTSVAKEHKAIDVAAIAAMAAEGKLDELEGEEIVLLGYGYPRNEGYIKDLGSLASMTSDPCCPEPIKFLNVTDLDISPLPFHSYFFQTTPAEATVHVALASDEPIEFASDRPYLYRGVFAKADGDAKARFLLESAEKVESKAGGIFGGI